MLASALTSLAAQAVDLPPAPVLEDEVDSDALGSGWYLRGDLGVAHQSISPRRAGADGLSALINIQTDHAASLGGGVGYRFSPWFRADLTVDHRFAAAFKGSRFAGNGAWAVDRAAFDATTLSLNGYLDLPLWDGITPYLGAGIGGSQARFDDTRRYVAGAAGVLPLPSDAETVFAWALMGGVAFEITTNLTVDFGYRYSRLDGQSSAAAAFQHRRIEAHEVRVGARYRLD
jgi:opacity protein-like surface antigen